MKAHLEYLAYVARHKWFVFCAGQKTGAPLWRLIIHDWSKLTRAEWKPYVEMFYGVGRQEARSELGKEILDAVQENFDLAWLHHQHHNPHHWQHWVLREDSGSVKAMEIPPELVREMVADWMGAGRAITGKWDVASWYQDNKEKMILYPTTRIYVEHLIEAVKGDIA